MLQLTEHVEITIFPICISKKTQWNCDIQNFYSQFSGPTCFYDVITT